MCVQDDSYVDNGFEYKCVLDTEGYLYFEPASCVTNDSVKHQPGDTWDSPEGVRWLFTNHITSGLQVIL